MKSTKLAKLTAMVVTACMIFTMMTPFVQAAEITEFPYSENFNSYADETFNTAFQNASGNTGVYWFYKPGSAYKSEDTLSICDDEVATSGHGKVVKYKNQTSVANTWIEYRFPTQETGKVLIQYDIKVKNPNCALSIIPRTKNYDKSWTGALTKFDKNTVEFFGVEEDSDYTFVEWNTVKHIIDIDAKTQTTYFKDKVVKTAVPNITDLSAVDFYWNSKNNKTEDAVDEIYLDDILINVISTPVEAQLFANDEKVAAMTGETDKLTLKVDSGFSAIPEITVTDYGNQITNNISDLTVNKELKDGNIVITIPEKLVNGHKYSVNIPEGTTNAFGQEIQNNKLEFICADKSIFWSEDFSGAENMNEVATANYVYGNSGFQFYTNNASGYEIVKGDSYTGGKALKLKANQTVYIKLPSEQLKTGTLKFGGHIIGDSNYTTIKMKNATEVLVLQFKENVLTRFLQQANEETGGRGTVSNTIRDASNNPVKLNPDMTFAIEMNLNDLSVPKTTVSDIAKNSYEWEIASPRMPHRTENKSTNIIDIMDNGIKLLMITAAGNTVIDTFEYEYIPNIVPLVEKVTFITADDEEVSYSKDAKLPAGTKAMKVKFTDAMDDASINKIKITGTEGNKTYTVEKADANTYVLTLDEALVADGQYKVSIPDTVKTSANLGIFNPVTDTVETKSGEFKLSSMKLIDTNGEAITTLNGFDGNQIKVIVDAKNTTGKGKSAVVLVACYKELRLIEVSAINTVEFDGIFDGSKEVPVTITDKAGADTMKAFVFESIENIKPLLPSISVPKV